MSLPLLIIPGDFVERERLRLIAIYNLPYRDFLFLLFFHPILVFVKLQGIFVQFLRMRIAAFCCCVAVPHNNASITQ